MMTNAKKESKTKRIRSIKKNRTALLGKEQNDLLLTYAKKTPDQVYDDLHTTKNGLKLDQIDNLREQYGTNSFSSKKKERWYHKLASAFLNPFSIILLIISVLTIIIALVTNDHHKIDTSDWVQFGIIMFITILSGVIKLFQESRSSKASEKLRAMVKTTTAVIRNGVTKELPIEEVVPGDLIKLAAGDMIPADMRILTARDLFITQSSLTGESEPMEKFVNPVSDDFSGSALDCNNLCFMGTSVSSGSAIGAVVNTGKNTVFGKMAKILNQKRAKTNFDKNIAKVSWMLIIAMIIMSIIVFVIQGLLNKEASEAGSRWLYALQFALAIAVGLTPEMLPMIVTLNLAKEAYKLSKQKTIVKNINSIQSFGAMDVLCTDKTGTLTEDKIVLERHINLAGDEDSRVLSYAFLNSYYQTGLKNLIDLAVIDKADKIGIDDPIMNFKKIDEIPFDFKRRRMSVIVCDNTNTNQLVTKGAYEEIVGICQYAEYDGKIVKLDDNLKKQANQIVNQLNGQGMRVIAIAINHDPLPTDRAFVASDESNMVLIGFIALLDPPKESSAKAVKALQEYGVTVKVLTGDNQMVTQYICEQVGIKSDKIILGSDIEEMDDDQLKTVVDKYNIFAKLNPEQKSRIVQALKSKKHVVGYMGDGINDAAAMKTADIGISVDTAVDIAKESADIILLEKDLMILEKSVVEGRKTFCNIIKYIDITVSSNFGNILSMVIASLWLPFQPMFTTQILILNLIYDFSQYSIPWDNVDSSYYQKPRQWNAKSIFRFMVCMGPISTIFDFFTFAILYWGYSINSVSSNVALFQTCWFFESLLSQLVVIYVLRTEKIPLIQSNPSMAVNMSNIVTLLIGLILVLVPGLISIHFASLIDNHMVEWLGIATALVLGYAYVAQCGKMIYRKIFHEWL